MCLFKIPLELDVLPFPPLCYLSHPSPHLNFSPLYSSSFLHITCVLLCSLKMIVLPPLHQWWSACVRPAQGPSGNVFQLHPFICRFHFSLQLSKISLYIYNIPHFHYPFIS